MQTLQNLDQIWFLVGAFLLGFLLAWLILPFFLRRNASRYEEQIESIQTSLRRREQDLISVRNQLDLKSDDLQRCHGERNTLTADLDAARANLETAQANLEATQANLETTQVDLDAATLTLEETQAVLSDTTTDQSTLQTELDEATSELSALRAAAADANSKLNAAEEALERASATLVDQREEADVLTARLKMAEETNLELEKTLADQLARPEPEAISGEVEESEQITEEEDVPLTTRMSMMLEEDEALEDALWQRELDLIEARDEINYLRASLSALTSISAELAGSIDKRNRDYAAMIAQLTDFLSEEGDEEHLALLTGDVDEQASEDTVDVAEREERQRAVALSETAPEGTTTLASASLSFDDLRRLKEQLDTYKRDTARYQHELEGALAAKAALESEFLSREEELSKLSQQMAGLEARLANVDSDLQTINGAYSKRNEEYRAARNQLAAMGPELDEALEQRDKLAATLAQREVLLEELQEQHAALAAEKEALEATFSQRMDDLNQLRAELADQTATMNELQDTVDGARAELGTALALLTPAPQDVENEAGERAATLDLASPAGVSELTTGITTMKEELAGIRNELDARDLALAETQNELDATSLTCDRLEEQLADLQGASGEKEAALTEEIADKEAQIEALTAEKTQLETQVADLTQQMESLHGALTEVEAAKAEAEAQLATVEASMDGVREQLLGVLGPDALANDVDVEALRAEGVDERTINLRLLAALPAVAAAKLGDQQSSLQQADNRIDELEESLQARQQALETAQAQLDELAQNRTALAEQITALEGQKSELEATVAQHEAALESAQAEAKTLRNSQSDLEASVNGLRAELAALEVDKSDLVTSLQEAETARLAAESELSDKLEVLERAPAIVDLANEIDAYPETKRTAANEALRLGTMPVFGPIPQDLTEIKGIGSAFQQRLYDAGVGTFWELANLPSEEMRDVLELTDWQLRSVDFEEIREDALHLAEATETIGKLWNNLERIDDFEPIPGIGRVYERRLYDAGIRTYEQLANASVETLAEACHAPKLHVPDYGEWIEHARALMAKQQDDVG